MTLIFVDMSYVAVVLASFQSLKCFEEVNGNSYLAAARDFQCGTQAHVVLMVFSFLIIALIGVGYPTVLFLMLRKHRVQSGAKLTPEVMAVWGYAFEGFRFKHTYWSVWQLLDNLAMCMVSALFPENAPLQGFLAALICLVYLIMVTMHRPYVTSFLNTLEVGVVSVEVSIIGFGFLFETFNHGRGVSHLALECTMLLALLLAFFVPAILSIVSTASTLMVCFTVSLVIFFLSFFFFGPLHAQASDILSQSLKKATQNRIERFLRLLSGNKMKDQAVLVNRRRGFLSEVWSGCTHSKLLAKDTEFSDMMVDLFSGHKLSSWVRSPVREFKWPNAMQLAFSTRLSDLISSSWTC